MDHSGDVLMQRPHKVIAMTILVVEDEQTDFLLIKHAIEQLNDAYTVLHAEGCREAVRAIHEGPVALALVDILLPDGDGHKITAHLKNHDIPFVMVSSKSMPENVVRSLKSGAEDYIRKPFDIEELAARLECVLRRTPGLSVATDADPLPGADVLRIDFTPIEHRLLHRLRLGYGTYITSEELIEAVWGRAGLETAKGALRTYISHIRKKLTQAESPLAIVSKWGRGYRLTDADGSEA
ncbi:signal transduction response regulator receiver domain [Desulfoluna spongiiphila]|nr:signal transduction response regulator receiver domain [Desulfoluna spongiiphila]